MQFGCSGSGAQRHPSVAAAGLEQADEGTAPATCQLRSPKCRRFAALQLFCLYPQPPKSQGCPTGDWLSRDCSILAWKTDEKKIKTELSFHAFVVFTCWALLPVTLFQTVVIGTLFRCWWRQAWHGQKVIQNVIQKVISLGWFNHEMSDSPLQHRTFGVITLG